MTFRFGLGDLVVSRGAVAEVELQARSGLPAYPLVYTVTGQIAETCSGGTQPNYRCSRGGQVRVFHECELLPLAEFNYSSIYLMAAENAGMFKGDSPQPTGE